MTKERLIELKRKAYGRGGETIHDPDLMEACDEIQKLQEEAENETGN